MGHPSLRATVRWLPWLVLYGLVAGLREPSESLGQGIPPTVEVATEGRAIVLAAALVCLGCAWTSSRWRLARWHLYPWSRPWWVIASRTVVVHTVVGTIAVFAPFLAHPRWDPHVPVMIAVDAAVLAGWGGIGYCLGLLGRRSLILPASIVIPWLWTVLPFKGQPYWLRHLTGAWDGCCSVPYVPATGAIWGSILLVSGWFVLCCVAVSLTHGRLRQRLAHRSTTLRALILIGGPLAVLAAVSPLVAPLGLYPVEPRRGEMVCERTAVPELCAWPEHAARLPQWRATLPRFLPAWHAVGYPRYARLTESSSDRDGKTVELAPDSSVVQIVKQMAHLPFTPCDSVTSGEGYSMSQESGEVVTLLHWLAEDTLRLKPGSIHPRGHLVLGPPDDSAHLPMHQRLTWLATQRYGPGPGCAV